MSATPAGTKSPLDYVDLETVLQTTPEGFVNGREIKIRGARYSRFRRLLCHVLDARTPPTSPTKSGTC